MSRSLARAQARLSGVVDTKNGCADGRTKIWPLLKISTLQQKCVICETNRFGITIIGGILEKQGKNSAQHGHVPLSKFKTVRDKAEQGFNSPVIM